MIYITMGHERSISLEIFFKAVSKFKNLPITLVVTKKDLLNFFSVYKYSYRINGNRLYLKNNLTLNLLFVSGNLPPSTLALQKVLRVIKSNDILVTMPTSKDQLILKGKGMAGHTEFFRSYYRNLDISMVFLGEKGGPVLLASDHIPLKLVPKLTSSSIYQKVLTVTRNFTKYFYPFKKIVLAGFNPHAGENGILGDEDIKVAKVVSKLKKEVNLEIVGPYSGDSLFYHHNKHTLLVYMYHDQGLGMFKAVNGFKGINISLGLPFVRISVDHGTAFDLYGKGKANASGMVFVLEWAKKLYERSDSK